MPQFYPTPSVPRVPPLDRWLPGLSAVRGIAASAVVLCHVYERLILPSDGLVDPRTRLPNALFGGLGTWGVGIFFVLSGMCIHLPYARKIANSGDPQFELGTYLQRRFWRIYPTHLVALLLSVPVAIIAPLDLIGLDTMVSVPTPVQAIAHLLMAHTFVPGARNSINTVLWTIAIEAHFYLVYPLFLRSRKYLRMEVICALLWGLMLGLMWADKYIFPPFLRGKLTYNFPGLLWQWVLGACLAEHLCFHGRRASKSYLTLALMVVGSASAHGLLSLAPHGLAIRDVLEPLIFAFIILAFSWKTIEANPALLERALLRIGHESYSLYLSHPISITLCLYVCALTGVPAPLRLFLVLTAVYAFSAAYFRMVEERFASPAPQPVSVAKV